MTSIFQEIVADIDQDWDTLKGSKVATMIDNTWNAAIAELESVTTSSLETAVETIGVAAFGGLSTTGTAAGAIAAGIAAAPAAFKTAEATITSSTTNVLVTSVVSQLQAQAATPSTQPASSN